MTTSLVEEALGGLSAGIIGTIIGYPLDVIKTHLQTSSSSASAATVTTTTTTASSRTAATTTTTTRHSLFSVGRHLVQTHGVLSLYRGVAPPLLSLSILNTFTFSAYSYFQHNIYQAHRGHWDIRNAAAGASCGPFAAVVSTVENLIKTQMQLDHRHQKKHARQFTSSWDCFRQLKGGSGSGGITTLYTGHAINTIREVTFLATYFYVYEGLRTEIAHHLSHQHFKLPEDTLWWAIPAAGGLSGAIAWTVSFPLDCIRASVQGQPLIVASSARRKDATAGTPTIPAAASSSSSTTGSSWQVARRLVASKGIMGLYAGASASILRAFLVSGTRFSAYEGMLYLLRGGRDMS